MVVVTSNVGVVMKQLVDSTNKPKHVPDLSETPLNTVINNKKKNKKKKRLNQKQKQKLSIYMPFLQPRT